jgi:hypothetical protein
VAVGGRRWSVEPIADVRQRKVVAPLADRARCRRGRNISRACASPQSDIYLRGKYGHAAVSLSASHSERNP